MGISNYLVTETGLKTYRREKGYLLYGKDGKPIRRIEWESWVKLKQDYPQEVADEALAVYTAWFLVEYKKARA